MTDPEEQNALVVRNEYKILAPPVDEKISFMLDGETVITITKQGFLYRGKMIEDAGEAHHLFIEFMKMAINGKPEVR